MKRESLSFECRVCNKNSEELTKNTKGYQIVAYDNVLEWSNFSTDVPALEVKIWERTSEIPVKGDLKKVQVHFPFYMSLGERFWSLFRPGWSNLNGWDDYPEEIASSAVVKCRFASIIARNEEKAWINIEIEEVLLLEDICTRLAPTEGRSYFEEFKNFRAQYYMVEYGEWLLLEANAQGDLGIWILVQKHQEKISVVLYGEWDFHSDWVYCGNSLITQEELSALVELALV